MSRSDIIMSFRNTFASIKTGFKIFLIVFAAALVLKILFNFSITNVIFFFGEKLEIDKYDHANILVLGIGGGNHQGPDLTDTMMVASVDEKNKSAVMFSIPRDIAVDVPNIWKGKGNGLYAYAKTYYKDSEKALETTKSTIENMLGIEIPYYIKIDFSAFKKIVDAVGGIDVYVDETLNDPYYPDDKTAGYNPLLIPQGWQHMNGDLALKYARSRETTSIFDRDRRQQKILIALKEKIITKGIGEAKIKDLFFALNDNVETNLSIGEIISLIETGKSINNQLIRSYEMHDDPSRCGGWLYPIIDEGNGGYMLLPAGNKWDKVQNLTNIIINNINSIYDMPKIQILNGTSRSIATKMKSVLTRYCLTVTRFGNAETNTVENTTYYIKNPVNKNFIYLLQKLIPGNISSEVPSEYNLPPYESDADVIIEIGNDYWRRPFEDPYDYIVLPSQKPKTTDATVGTATNAATDASKTTPSTTPANSPANSPAKSNKTQ